MTSQSVDESGDIDYHSDGYTIGSDENAGHRLGWILNGAARGLPGPVPTDAPLCLSAGRSVARGRR